MTEYIEREAAQKEIERFAGYLDEDMIYRIKTGLSRIPAADVRPVVKAHWIRCNNWAAGYKCSACKARVSNADVLNGNHHYCYKCGAMMEES